MLGDLQVKTTATEEDRHGNPSAFLLKWANLWGNTHCATDDALPQEVFTAIQ
jgi:hypothetical protein